MFVDRVTIRVQAGRGGDGCVSFRREKYVPRGGPDGGDGGDGGSVLLVAEPGVDSLAALAHRRHWKAVSGGPGGGKQCHGANGDDLVLRVPPGTVVMDAAGGFVLKDLAAEGAQVIAAHGGRGGKGNVRFKSSTNRTPRTATKGTEGEDRELVLELKMIADVGLVGKPNAGKSTLLSRLSRARPRIAAYPFTTKKPNLGIAYLDIDRSLTLADIPGLIEGAHHGAGLGLEFLRHIERTRILVHLVEPQPTDGSDPLENYRAIRNELAQHSQTLAQREEVIVISKAELPGAEEVRQQLAEATGREVMLISSVTGQSLDRLLARLSAAVDAQVEQEQQAAERASSG
ncbi:MAG: GTPase ObgE [Pirellulales bacterium]